VKYRRPVIIMLVAVALLALPASLFFGSSGFGLPDLSSVPGKAVLGLRLSRMFAALVVGAALASAGAVFQALLRNPLCEPYVLGVSSGAALGACCAILPGIGGLLTVLLPGAAFVGGIIAMALVLLIAGGSGSSIYTLILSGVIVSSVGSSLLMFMVSMAPVEGMHHVVWWMLGNLQPSSSALLWVSAALIVAGIAGMWWLAPELNILTMGRETAHYLGVRTRTVVFTGLLLATLVTSAAVGLAGMIGFVGLIVPHAVRALIGPDHRRLIPVAALCGGGFLALCDAAARSMIPLAGGGPVEIQVGVLTALCGGPFFIVLLKLRGRRAWIGGES